MTDPPRLQQVVAGDARGRASLARWAGHIALCLLVAAGIAAIELVPLAEGIRSASLTSQPIFGLAPDAATFAIERLV